MLTRKQYDLLVFIDGYLKRFGVSPSYEEMKDALDLKSKSGIHRLITGLEERGFIRRLPHRARALEVLRLPENRDQTDNVGLTLAERGMNPYPPRLQVGLSKGFHPTLIDGANQFSGVSARQGADAVALPLYGRIAAGTPIEALRDPSDSVDVPISLLGRGDHYALEVEGDSMIDAGINDGDTVIIQRGDTADNGSIVVALVDNEEVTLKRLRRRGASIALEPANPTYETRIFGPDRVKVQGYLVGLMRKY